MRTICVIVYAVQWTPERNGIRLNAGFMSVPFAAFGGSLH